MVKLISDIDANQTKRILEVLRDETLLMKGFTMHDLDVIAQVLKILTFKE